MFWEIYTELCESKNLKPTTVAQNIGLSNAIPTKWKNGALPKGEILLKLAEFFDCSVDYLLTGKEKSPYLELDEKEQRLLEYFKLLNPDEKIEIIGELKGMTRGRAESKNVETA